MSDLERLREALARIADVASEAVNGDYVSEESEEENGASSNGSSKGAPDSCTLKSLPKRLLVKGAQNAVEINPVNAPMFGQLGESALAGVVSDPLSIAVLTSKYWGPMSRRLTVSFMESTPSDLRARIISHMNAWTRTGGISFVETSGAGVVRISRGGGGYWSYLGTDVRLIPTNRQTMNLQGFTMNTPESEYKRVVRHETGHTLGYPHEHMRRQLVARIDPQKAYDYFLRTQGWNRQTVDQQVLTPLNDATIFATPPDQTSIMCYQLPGSITRDGLPITGGVDINQTDYAFNGKIYPKSLWPWSQTASEQTAEEEDWGAESDVVLEEYVTT
jgi:Astacin (Peptidase family M12A)